MNFPYGEISFRIIPSPRGDPALARFRCGWRKRDRAVNRLVRRQYRGTAKHRPTVMAMEHQRDGVRQVIGLSAWRPRILPALGPTPEPQLYIHMIGIRRAHRGGLASDGTTLGQSLLAETLLHIATAHSEVDHVVWALVAKRNDRSNRMFANSGFKLLAPERERRFAALPIWLFPRWSFPGDAIQIRGLPENALSEP